MTPVEDTGVLTQLLGVRVFLPWGGEVSGCRITPVQKGQFTPLGPALCWVLHAEGGSNVSMRDLRDALIHHFPSLIPPDEETTHAALTELIKQRRIFHAGKGYSLVTPGTYGHSATLPDFAHHPPFRLMTTSEALTRAHGAAEVIPAGSITHAAVQTDLADLLTHHNHPAPDDGDARAASLRSGKLGTFVSTTAIATYFGKDLTDISVRVDRSGSMLSKLLRVSSPRMGSFSAQFPPPEWSRANTCQRHGHCRATQTPLVTQLAAAPEDTATASSQWVSRSSSLPRRHARPLSSTFHAAPEVLSNGPSPSHRHRHRSPSPSHALQGGCTSHNAAYSNPYQNMALHNQHNKQQQDEFACNKQALHGNYSIYGYAIDGLPPRPPIPSSIHYDFMHRRTLSASPRRMLPRVAQADTPSAALMTLCMSPKRASMTMSSNITLTLILLKLFRFWHIESNPKYLMVPAVETVGAGDNNSVRTYPSLSELNFSSLAAQKILRGVSINSIDTLLEVNIAAGEVAKPQEPVTNTDFGYL
ncbi:hypothetical protein HAZT_HAZT003872 [Hyalella azteca]|uniref:Winged helix Storkhead-box1 domain-containing protein n=1 Tax=Hyalella azteca TaxID=294128 RepID=A0A6A0H2G8_HYAAZ|nr:hypothetical protein HAZT_HAZT003872 [Hyalella azteca]